jgi:hypothetical protein
MVTAAEPARAQWETLRQLRKAGKRPTFPLYLTDSWMFSRNLGDAGAMVITHPPGLPMPVELLDGLDVRLHFAACDKGGRVVNLIRAKGVKPQSLQVWCDCACGYTVAAGPCDDGSEPWAQ